MNKKTTKGLSEENNETHTESVATPTFTHVALSIVKKPGAHNSIVRIQYNPETGEVGKLEVIKKECGKAEAEEIFKINVAREIFAKE